MNIALHLPRFLKITGVIILLSINSYAQTPPCKTYVLQVYNETYSYLSGGTSVNLQSDDITVRNIPIGFTFMFCGTNYTQLSACSNGWISLGNSSSTTYTNSAASSMSSIVPVFMPVFDDLYGVGGVSSYKTTGTAPNRVFTFEWKDWRPLSYTSSAQISFQVRLYEGTNAIKFHYKKEGSNPLPSATIGIGYSTSDYLTLPNSGTSPTPSSTTFTTSVTSYPAIGQVYEWDPPIPCDPSTSLIITAYNSQGATFSWTGVAGAMSYDFAIDKSATLSPASTTSITNTITTNGAANGLTPSTLYYLHVRTRCSSVSISQWDTVSFTTLPPCSKPNGFIASNVDSNSANIQWTPAGNVLQYKYVVDRNMATPSSSNPNLKTTTTTFVSLPDTLQDGTLYYVHIRAMCVANDSSIWSLDSFRTPVPCRKAQLSVTYLSANNSVTSWPLVPTAYNYEYYLGPLTTLPPNGTPIFVNTVMTPYLLSNTSYTMSVRCNCEFYGVKTTSDWSSVDFTTLPPTAISSTGNRAYNVVIFPNPAKDKFTLIAKGAGVVEATVQISNINGKVMMTLDINKEYTDIDIAGFTPGIYLVKYTDKVGTKTVKLLIQ